MFTPNRVADVCLVLEGTYPYVSGGVSTWVHDLIRAQSHLTFHLICVLPLDANPKEKYTIPENVIGIQNLFLQKLPRGAYFVSKKIRKQLFEEVELPLMLLQHRPSQELLQKILKRMHVGNINLGRRVLLNSQEAWRMLIRMYHATVDGGSFLNFFWSWRGLLASLYSVLMAPIPPAKVYHTVCTGYAGLLAARAHLETGKPCLLTEHGIYTNERRIEITAAQWLNDQKSMNLTIIRPGFERDLKDYWIDTFLGYSKLCYQACSKIVTLYEGNKQSQIDDGADPEKISIIQNGIDFEDFSSIPRDLDHPTTIALIGRVVSIKDVKTFIRAIEILIRIKPNIRCYIMGPTVEEKEYYLECVDLVNKFHLQDVVVFTDKVDIRKYLGQIDVIVLTSVSEAQPLVLLECGAAGIPFVATDVGACREIAFGRSDEMPNLGQGGVICSLYNPTEVANGIARLLRDDNFYRSCSETIRERVRRHYDKKNQDLCYRQLYDQLIHRS